MPLDVRILVVSVYYNRENSVKESVRSVVDQLGGNDIFLLVDDGSTDNTYLKLKEFETKNVRVVSYQNSGFVNAIRKAIDSIDSEFIAIHGSGDISLPGRFESQITVFEKSEAVGLVGTWYEDISMLSGEKYIHKKNVDSNAKRTLEKYNPFCHSSVMFRRNVYDKVGGYRNFFVYAQDRDLWCRMSHHCEFKMLDKVYIKRYHSMADSVSGDYKKRLRQCYLSAFAVFMHVNNFNETLSVEEASLYYVSTMSFKKNLLKLSINYFVEGQNEAIDYYKPHVISGSGIFFYPLYVFINLFPGVSRYLAKYVIERR